MLTVKTLAHMKRVLKYLFFTYKIVDVTQPNLTRYTHYKVSYRPRIWVYPIAFVFIAIAKFGAMFIDYLKEMKNLLFDFSKDEGTLTIKATEKPTVDFIYDSILP